MGSLRGGTSHRKYSQTERGRGRRPPCPFKISPVQDPVSGASRSRRPHMTSSRTQTEADIAAGIVNPFLTPRRSPVESYRMQHTLDRRPVSMDQIHMSFLYPSAFPPPGQSRPLRSSTLPVPIPARAASPPQTAPPVPNGSSSSTRNRPAPTRTVKLVSSIPELTPNIGWVNGCGSRRG